MRREAIESRPLVCEGWLIPTPPGKEYRLLKVVPQPATAEQVARLGNDRASILSLPPGA